jgi:dTDP-4-amino-4,6-dideoxygalactose transaminase
MAWRIPLVDLEALHRPIREEMIGAVASCIDRQNFILGEAVETFEREIAAYCEVPFALGVSSGTDALLMCLMAYSIGPGDEVVTTPYSFFASAGVVHRLGATPVFADIEEESFNIDPELVAESLSPRTRVILPVHLYGQCADTAPILALAEARRLVVVEDAAQAIGARHRDGRRAGAVGELGAFSFYPSKNLSAIGDAGLVTTRDESLADSLRRLRTHGGSSEYLHQVVGGNFRIDALQAAVLTVKLRHLDEWTRRRKERARRYDELFQESGLSDGGEVRTPKALSDHVYHQYVIRTTRRNALRDHLAAEGIATGIYYPVPLHLQPCFRELGYARGDFPNAERACEESLALPIHPDLTFDQQRIVVGAIADFHGAR